MECRLLTKGMREALLAIRAREGTFGKTIARKIEAAGLAVHLPSASNALVRCNVRYAHERALTEDGLRVIEGAH